MSEEQIIIFQSKLGETDYEIKSVLPSWTLTKYLMSQYAILEKGNIDDKTAGVFDEIASKCFKSWRVGDKGDWNKEMGDLPGAVVMSYILTLATQSNVRVTTTLKTKKN